MTKKFLSFIGLLVLALSAGGCAQHMTKEDNASPPPAAESNQQAKDSQNKADAKQTAKAQEAAPVAGEAALNEDKAAANQKAATKAKHATPQETAAAAKLLPLPPKEIVETIDKLTTLPRVRYLSRSAQYDYYVGGRVDAKYDINKSQLVVTNAPSNDKNPITCEYSKDGNMISGGKAAPSYKVEECNQLIKELTTYLSR